MFLYDITKMQHLLKIKLPYNFPHFEVDRNSDCFNVILKLKLFLTLQTSLPPCDLFYSEARSFEPFFSYVDFFFAFDFLRIPFLLCGVFSRFGGCSCHGLKGLVSSRARFLNFPFPHILLNASNLTLLFIFMFAHNKFIIIFSGDFLL